MHTWTDAVANVHGRIKGQNATAPALVIGSHYDTVKDAGKFDGALGILVGIAAVKALVFQVALTLKLCFYVFCAYTCCSTAHLWLSV